MKNIAPGRFETDDGQTLAFMGGGAAGAAVEDVLDILVAHLEARQAGLPDAFTFQCIGDLRKARQRLVVRADMRRQRGVAGTQGFTHEGQELAARGEI